MTTCQKHCQAPKSKSTAEEDINRQLKGAWNVEIKNTTNFNKSGVESNCFKILHFLN